MTGEVTVYGWKRLCYDIDEGVINDADTSVIILSTSGEPRWKYVDMFFDSLVLNYDDVIDGADPYAYTDEMAARVATLVHSVEANISVTNLYVVCDYGESRSAGLAAAVIRYLGAEDLYLWDSAIYHPNPLVYRKTCAALGIEVTDEDISYLTEINQKTFREAIPDRKKEEK